MVIVVEVGTVVTIKLVSSKSSESKLELVAELKLSKRMISYLVMLWSDAKVIVTVASLCVVVKALVKVVVALIGVMS